MSDIDTATFGNSGRQAPHETRRRAALTICRSAVAAGGTEAEVRDALEQLGLLDGLREETA